VFGGIEHRLQVGRNHLVKILFAHAKQQGVSRNSCIIYHDINVAKARYHILNQLLSLFAAGRIAPKAGCFAVLAEFGLKSLSSFYAAQVGEGHLSTFLRKAFRDGLANSF
jgi:hypothetical protein